MNSIKLPVAKIQRFSVGDGDSIRTTVFLRGCPLKCFWCHNPEMREEKAQMLFDEHLCISCGGCAAVCPLNAHSFNEAGEHQYDRKSCIACGACAQVCPTLALEPVSKDMSIEEILDFVMADSAFYGDKGGLTVSGGEPMYHADGCIQLLKEAKKRGLNTALETSGFFPSNYVCDAAKYVDTFLWDYKDSDRERHYKNTGVYPDAILENLYALDSLGAHIVLRCIIIEGVNNNPEHFRLIDKLCSSLKNCRQINYIPYHPMGGAKARLAGMPDNSDEKYIPLIYKKD